jgi:cyclophilin family peptidyl-prolyl cis-trans isomerase
MRQLLLLVIGFALSTFASLASAQESKPAETPAAAASAPASPVQAKFDEELASWNKLLARLREVQVEYKSAPPDKRKPLREEFNRLLADGDAAEPKLLAAAEAAYRAAPNKSQPVVEVLESALMSDLKQDAYEDALPLATLLIDNKASNARVYAAGGIAAYETNHYDEAEKYLKHAEENSALDEQGRTLLAAVPDSKAKWAKEQEIRAAEAKANDLPRVELKTSKGTIVVELFENEAPLAVANFIHLVEKGFYNGLAFHRVLPGFMAQGGDPEGNGAGGPGYKIPCECYAPNHRFHFRGSLSMAHAGRDTGGSQFFLTFVRTSHLDDRHTVFGRVIEGMDVLSKLQRRDPTQQGQPAPDKIITAKVLRKRDHKYEPTTTEDVAVAEAAKAKAAAKEKEPAKENGASEKEPGKEKPSK